jgi:hypothetical protein
MFIHGGYRQRNDKEGHAFLAEGPLAHGIMSRCSGREHGQQPLLGLLAAFLLQRNQLAQKLLPPSGSTQYRPNDLTDCSEHDQKQSQPPQHFISTLKSCRSWIATDRNPNWLSSSANPIRHAVAE